MEITVQIEGLEEVIASVDGLTQIQADQLLEVVANVIAGQNRRRVLEDTHGPNGEAWPPLNEKYAQSPRKKGNKILVVTGNMARSIGYEVSGDTAWIGPSAYYAGYVHGGTSKMPARPFIGVSQDNRSEIEKVIEAFMTRALGGGS